MDDTAPLTLELDADVTERLQRLADAAASTPDGLARQAIAEYVERAEARRQFLEESDAAWREYVETGLHLTGKEVDAWFDKVANGEDAEPPECHT